MCIELVFADNDNNSLNKKFYSELLHNIIIIRLTEIQETGKK
jgi:hypothetical protein